MKTKFYAFAAMVALSITGCNTMNEPEINSDQKQDASGMKETEVMATAPRKAPQATNEPGYNIPDDGKYHVYYFIRIDGNVQDEYIVGQKSEDYFPRTATKKTQICDLNMGYVKSDIDWKSSIKFSKYVYSSDGKAVQNIILKEPTLKDLVDASKYAGDAQLFENLVKDSANLHFLWYACKKQDKDGCWHIDGVLTRKSVKDISETSYGDEIIKNYGYSGEVEVDIHQQEHKDWNEIKTSIHLRDTVGVNVFLPIEYQAQADDFDIRYGKDYEYITEMLNCSVNINGVDYPLEVSIQHEEAGIRINILPNNAAIKAAFEYCGDGITYEIHSYVNNKFTKEYIWEILKKSTVTTTPHTSIYGQITSAYFTDEVKL